MKAINEITTTLRIGEDKYSEFKEYSKSANISLNSTIKMAAHIGLKVLKGEFQNVALVENPVSADSA